MCEEILFSDVCTVLHKLSDPFLKPLEKLNFFSRYILKIDHESPSDLFPLLRLLVPSLDRRRPSSQLRQPLLARIYAQVFALPAAAAARLRLYKDPAAITPETAASAQVGDFGSFVAVTLKQRIGRRSPTITVRELNAQLDLVCLAAAFPEKIAVLQKLLPQLTVHEHKWFVRILMKDVKLGGLTGERLLTVLHPGARKIINQCSDLQSTLEVIEEQLKVKAVDDGQCVGAKGRQQHGTAGESNDTEELSVKEREGASLLFRPLRPMLAQPVRPATADIQLKLFTEPATAGAESGGATPTAPRASHYFVERKYDGERVFAHIDLTRNRESEKDVFVGKQAWPAAAESLAASVRLFSRRGRDISKQYGGSQPCSGVQNSTSELCLNEAKDAGGDATVRQSLTELEAAGDREGHDEQFGEEKRLRRAENAVLEGLRVMLAKALKGSQAILDGELLAWDDERRTFLPFGTNRSVAVSETTSCHLSYVVFDILFYRNTDGDAYSLLSMQLKDRKTLLERVLKPVGSRIMLASYVEATQASQVIDRFNAAVHKRHEGIVVKLATSFYHLHSRRGGWYKIKPQSGSLPDTLDLIVIGAFFAETTRRREHTSTHAIDHCSHFLLGVLEGRGGRTAARVRSFCRIGSGFSLTELAQMRDFVRPYCCRLPPLDPGRAAEEMTLPVWLENCRLNASTRVDVTWPPSKSFVMEISAAEIIPSVEFDIGFTLRFATAIRPFRRDKEWYEAMSEDDLKAFFVASDERGGLCISCPEAPLSSVRPVVNSGSISPTDEEAGDDETEREEDEGMYRTVDVADENRHIVAVHRDSCTVGGELSKKLTSDLLPSECSSLYKHPELVDSSSPSGSLTNVRSRQRLRYSTSRFWRSTHMNADLSDRSTSSVKLQGLYLPTTTESSTPSSSVLRGQRIWVMEGADEDGDEVSSRSEREERPTRQDAKPTKIALEWLVAALGGTVAPALSGEVTYIIAARQTFRSEAAAAASAEVSSSVRERKRAKGAALQRRPDISEVMTPPVLHYGWLLDCARLNALAPVRPVHVLHGTPALAREFAGRYDKYGDAFFEQDSSPRSLLPIIESAVANKKVETGTAESHLAKPRQKKMDCEFCALQGEAQRSPGNGAHDVNVKDRDVQAPELRKSIAELSNSSELSSVVLFVPPTDVVWTPPCAIKSLQPSSLQVEPHPTRCPSRDGDVSDSSDALPISCSVLMREMQKATRAALIARCCVRGMRLTFHHEEATHVLISPPIQLAARNKGTRDLSGESESNTEGVHHVGDAIASTREDMENSNLGTVFEDGRMLGIADVHPRASEQLQREGGRKTEKHQGRPVSELYLRKLLSKHP